MQLGGSEDEQNVLRRFLECFEQRIERTDGQHVYLVDDEHALADLCRRVARLIAQVADVVHTVVGRRINLGPSRPEYRGTPHTRCTDRRSPDARS